MVTSLTNLLNHIPVPSSKRIAMHVTPAAERALRDGHPWLFDGGIRDQRREGNPGDLAVIFDQKDRFMAVGFYDPNSPIRVKVLQHNDPAVINADWFREKLIQAIKIRQPLADSGDTDGYRLIYGENDGLPGLVIDRYAQTLVIKIYTAAWIPHLATLLPLLDEVQPAQRWVLRMAREIGETYGLYDGQVLKGTEPDGPVQFHENGLTFAADVVHGHKTGFFFDQRDNRARVGQLAAGKRVLDVFAYSGGFSVYAAHGGAQSVTSLDISAPALDAAQLNMQLNHADPNVANAQHEILVMDAFEGMAKLHQEKRQFDLVIVDPPAFAKRKDEIDRALAAYRRLAELAIPLVAPGGDLVMASCSSRVTSEAFFKAVRGADSHHRLRVREKTFHALDHPVGFPEGAYLKCLFLLRD